MTDKQIIIDEIDVADCEHLNSCNKKMKCVILQDDICETNPYCEGFNCYYKQLKRAEQRIVELNKTIQAKEQECEELKKFLSKEPLALQALQTGYASYKKSSDTFYNMVKDYKQAIEKIKEIAERVKGYDPLAKQILQICDEVNDDNA